MNKKLIFYTVALTAGLLTACSSDDEQKQDPPVRHISVEVNQRPMTSDDPAGARSTDTRSAITTTETFSAFSMRGIYSNLTSEYSVSKSNDTWTVTPNRWPEDDYGNIAPNETKVQFYAYTYTKGTFVPNSGTPFIDFTVDEDAFKQHDLLVAKNNVAYSAHDGKVPLTFDHACAALAFNVFMSNTLSTNLAGKTLTVSSIVLKNVSNTGKYYFETAAWDDVKGTANYTLNNSPMVITTTSQELSSNHLFMIPQERAADGENGTYLKISYTVSGQEGSTAIIPLTVNWEKSTQYTINIKLGTKLITW